METADVATNTYIAILEKTNQQLGLWSNPYGIMVMVLTILVALLAISFAYILWRQGKEYREVFKSFLEEQKKIACEKTAEMIVEAKMAIDQQIHEGEEKMVTLHGEEKAEFEKEIEDLKMKKKSLDTAEDKRQAIASWAISSFATGPTGPIGFGDLTGGFCIHCGTKYTRESRYCAHCGNGLLF